MSWLDYWSAGEVSVYAGRRHLEAHYRRILADVRAVLPDRRPLRLLDYGCGDALAAPGLAEAGIEVMLYDRSPAVQARLAQRFAQTPGIRCLDDAAYGAMASGSVDVFLVVSVVQYLDETALGALFAEARRRLAPDGLFILADVIEPGTSILADVRANLGFAAANGFFWAALVSLARSLAGPYRALRQRHGLAMHAAADMLARFAKAGFAAQVAPRNIGPTPHRRTFLARPN